MTDSTQRPNQQISTDSDVGHKSESPCAPKNDAASRPLAGAGLWLQTHRDGLLGIGGLVVFWAISRTIMRWIWATRATYMVNDVLYYHYSLRLSDDAALSEYPTPILWLLRALDALAFGNSLVFQGLLIGLIALLDLSGALLLAHFVNLRAGWYWCVYLALIGPLIWFRLDLFPAFLVMMTLLCSVTGRDTGAGVSLALAAASKFWPAILIGVLIGFSSRFARRLRAFVVVGGVIGAFSLIVNGWDRSLSPLTWQSDRGLQVESVLATRPMFLHAVPGSGYRVIYSRFNAYEVVGPDVEMWLRGADVAFVVAILLSVTLSVLLVAKRWRIRKLLSGSGLNKVETRGSVGPTALACTGHRNSFAEALIALAIISALIVSNKTYSPQYMIWLAGPVALMTGSARDTFEWACTGILGLTCLVAAWLTQMIYPLHYGGLVTADLGTIGDAQRLVVRNLLMLFITLTAVVMAGWAAWRVDEGHSTKGD